MYIMEYHGVKKMNEQNYSYNLSDSNKYKGDQESKTQKNTWDIIPFI